MVKLLILCMFLSGLIHIINYNHGFDYIITKLKNKTKNIYIAQSIIILIISSIHAIFAYDIKSVQILTPIIQSLSNQYNISFETCEVWLYLIPITLSCLIPYAPIILLAQNLSHITYIHIIQYMIYPIILYCYIIISIFYFKK